MANIVHIRQKGFRLLVSGFGSVLFCILLIGQTTATAQQQGFGQMIQQRSGAFGAMGGARQPAASQGRMQQPRRVIKRDSVVSVIPDSLRSRDSQFEHPVYYDARDSTIMDVDEKMLYLYGDAAVTYGEIELKAAFIKLDWGKNEVYAHGLPDSTKKVGDRIAGRPVFSQGADPYYSDTIRYNFKTRRAIIKNIVTQQGEGFVQGERVKKDSLDNLYLVHAKYTTCNLKEPHFHIAANKIKLINRRNIISGPFNLVVADVPLPIGLPFGFFPVPKKKEIGTSGFIMGQYGEEPRNRGYYFRDFGYYHAFNERVGIKILGQIYSRGSWGLGGQSTYMKRYRYQGNVSLQYNFNQSTDLKNPRSTNDFSINWSHSPQNRRPDRSFGASVNLQSNGYNRNNRQLQEVNLYTNNTSNSSIQYTRNFGKLVRTSTALRADQNFGTRVFNGDWSYSLGLNQFNPFVREEDQTGRWFEAFRVGLDISGGYRVSNDITSRTRSLTYTDYSVYGVEAKPLTSQELALQNTGINRSVTVLTLGEAGNIQRMFRELGQFRTTYSVPIALPNFKLAKFINITPSVSYRGEIFSQKLQYRFLTPDLVTKDGAYALFEPFGNVQQFVEIDGKKYVKLASDKGQIAIDTLNGLYNAFSTSASLSMNTRLYRTMQFKNLGRLQAIRHTSAPSVSLNYAPGLRNLYFFETKVRTDDTVKRFLPYFPQLGTSAADAGQIGFSWNNQLEAKVRAKSDTAANQYEKIMLLNDFSVSGGYNLLAYTVPNTPSLSMININANTSLFKDLININVNGTVDPYAYVVDTEFPSNLAGRRTIKFKWSTPGFAGSYLSAYQISLSTRLSPQTFNRNKNKQNTESSVQRDPAREAMERFVRANPMAYVDFNIPWTLNFNFNYGFNRQGLAKPLLVGAVQFTGDFSLTPKWKFNYSTGYDFINKATTLTTIGVVRDLHCWDMSFNWTPIAGNQLRMSNYSFDLKVRSSLLQDLKLSRRRIYYDVGGF